MGSERAVMDSIRQILIEVWDPVGVRAIPQAHDEYDGCVGAVARALMDGADVAALQALLEHIVVNEIGLPAGSGNPQGAAERIVALGWRESRASHP